MNFIPRDKAPAKTNKFYYTNINKYVKNGYPLPNCTCYAYGRAYEVLNKQPDLPTANAKNWYASTKHYKKDKEPSVGSIICFGKGKSGKGHVAFVEYFDKKTKAIKTSNSAYKGTLFYMQTLKPPYNFGTYEFQGFIHIIDVSPEPEPTQPHIYYIVQKGDNLSKIAKKYGTTWKDIYNKNKTLIDNQAKKHGIKSNFFNHIYIGQKLLIK